MADHKQPHFVLFPFMAPGHMIPMIDIARLLARRGVAVTILLTHRNSTRIAPVIHRAIASGLTIRVEHLHLPCADAGLPDGCENFDMLASTDDVAKFFTAAAMMRNQVETLLREVNPSCLISDMCFPWTTDVAMALHVPRIVFHGVSCFALVIWYILQTSDYFVQAMASDTDYFVVPGLPDKVEFTLAQLRGTPKQVPPGWHEIRETIRLAGLRAFGTVCNTFTELEPEYVKEYAKAMDKPFWCIGPVSLFNDDELDKAERGEKSSIDKHQCLQWLDSTKPGSVMYVCLGSLVRVMTPQLIELGLALAASSHPFIWVVKNVKDNDFKAWLKEVNFEDKVKGRGLLIHGWAPQVLILSHPSVGGFLTHCGWNSTIEGITAGVPLVTWPMFAEQFSNEKLVVEVIKTGVRVGMEMPVLYGEEEAGGVQVMSREIMMAIDEVMDGGDEGEARRGRARWLREMARRAMDVGGSSYMNITRLIEDVEQAKHDEEFGKDAKLNHQNCAQVVVQ